MKKRITYQPSVEIRTTSEVITAKCTCPAGSTPAYCKHVFALLHAIVDYVSKELFYASTERLQTWHHPKSAKTISQEANKIFAGECRQNVNCKIRILTATNCIFVHFWKRREMPRK
ncbi:SWIM-type domain-containing protein [Trichonephila clavata]|uniref:SWIM-type domain-containing protein n=1 Tax=Trichonephila clavata TaxID=2740835 RepID=A0A8X6HAT8_TRICU|nr:SWIM-type domain-containing protein [Trichonephila clavata]